MEEYLNFRDVSRKTNFGKGLRTGSRIGMKDSQNYGGICTTKKIYSLNVNTRRGKEITDTKLLKMRHIFLIELNANKRGETI